MRYLGNIRFVRWGAALACAVAAVTSGLRHDWLRSGALACIAVVFVLLATETQARWTPRKTLALVLIIATIVLLVARLLAG